MVTEQIGSGFRKAWFLGNKGFVCKALCFPIYRYPNYLWLSVSKHRESYSCLLLLLLPGPWRVGRPTVPLPVPHQCEPRRPHAAAQNLLWGQLGIHRWANISRVHRDTRRSEGGKSKASLEAGAGDILFSLDATSVWAAVLLTKEDALGKSGFVFSHVNRFGCLSPTHWRAVSSDSQRPPSDQLLALPVIRDQFLLLAKNRGATCQEQKIKRGGQPSERERNSKIRLAIINSRFKLDAIMANLGTDPALLESRHPSLGGPSEVLSMLLLGQWTERGNSCFLRPS